jgi:hypothetical protein
MTSADRCEHLITRLKDEGQRTLAFFKVLEPAQWEMQVYDTGAEWTARQVLCHFISAERNLLRLFKSIAKGGQGAPADFDIDRFNDGDVARMDDCQVAPLFEQFGAARDALVNFVDGLEDADLDRVGRHPFLGVVALESMIKLIYRHNMLHQKDVQKAIQIGKPITSNEQ